MVEQWCSHEGNPGVRIKYWKVTVSSTHVAVLDACGFKGRSQYTAGCEIYSMKPVCLAKLPDFAASPGRGFYRQKDKLPICIKSRQNSLYGGIYPASRSSPGNCSKPVTAIFLCASVVTLRRPGLLHNASHIQRACWAHFTLLGFCVVGGVAVHPTRAMAIIWCKYFIIILLPSGFALVSLIIGLWVTEHCANLLTPSQRWQRRNSVSHRALEPVKRKLRN